MADLSSSTECAMDKSAPHAIIEKKINYERVHREYTISVMGWDGGRGGEGLYRKKTIYIIYVCVCICVCVAYVNYLYIGVYVCI